MKNYANAKDVLPKDLFNELKKHFNAGTLYVPATRHEEKRALVLALHARGTGAKEMAMMSGLSRRRVYQVIAQERRKNAFSGCAKE